MRKIHLNKFPERPHVLKTSLMFVEDNKICYVTLYNLRNDKGDIIRYNKKLFLNLDEWREKQLNKIL
jgi:hypothetical protein